MHFNRKGEKLTRKGRLWFNARLNCAASSVVEHRLHTAGVGGSKPSPRTKIQTTALANAQAVFVLEAQAFTRSQQRRDAQQRKDRCCHGMDQLYRHLLGNAVAKQNGWNVGEHHAQRGSGNNP